MRTLMLAVLLVARAAFAQEEGERPKSTWTLTVNADETPQDGRHLGISWDREGDPFSTVVIFRRPAGPSEGKGGRIHVVDQLAQLTPMFMHPDTFRTQYYPAFDANQHPIPPGTQLGVWTVVASFDGDPAHPIIDTVEPGTSYVYALVPAEPGAAPDTYESLDGDAIVTPALQARPASLVHMRWFQIAVGVLGLGLVAGGIVLVKRRRRAGARPSAEAS